MPALPVILLILGLLYVVFRQKSSNSRQVPATTSQGCYGNVVFLAILFFPLLIFFLGVSMAFDSSSDVRQGALILLVFGLIGPVFLIYRLWTVYQLRAGGMSTVQALREGLRLESKRKDTN